MADSRSENIRDWLRDAHALEEQGEKLFSGQVDRLKDYPELRAKLTTELNFFRDFQKLLSIRIQQLGSEPSVIKDTVGKLLAGAQNFSGTVVSDEPVKGILALHTFNQFAIGSYKILISATEALSDETTRQLSQKILDHVEARALWLDSELDTVTKRFLIAHAA